MARDCCPDCGRIGHRGRCSLCRSVRGARRSALAQYNAAVRAENREIERGNRRRRRCLERIFLACVAGNQKSAEDWLWELELAGFKSSDIAAMRCLPLAALLHECRELLGLPPVEKKGSG